MTDYGTVSTMHFDPANLIHYCEGKWIPGTPGLCSAGRQRSEHILYLTREKDDGQVRAAREGA